MSEQPKPYQLSSDKPQTDPSQDRFGYAPFARHLARSISEAAAAEGLVMGIYAPWGSGKSTALNFVEHYLRAIESERKSVIVHFNPWWFSGQEDLAQRFFSQFVTALGKEGRFQGLRGKLANWADAVSDAPIPYAASGKVFAKILRPATKSIPDLKAEVAEELKKQDAKILVVIDDIDRLSAEEIRQLFKVVKAVGDFPRVVYLLAFAKEVVTTALSETQGTPGAAYLEKIVQVPFELPLPDQTSLRKLLFERLDAILKDTPEEAFDQTRWGNVYFSGIDPFIRTPRDIVRLTNSLSVTHPAVAGEVNSVDFIAIEALRVFLPTVYDTIRKNPDMFTGNTEALRSGGGQEATKTFHDAMIDGLDPEQQAVTKRLLAELFPKCELTWERMGHGPEWENRWRRELRVCSADVFPVYFRLAVPEGATSHAEMQAVVGSMQNEETFEALLLSLSKERRPDGLSRARSALERLEDFTEEAVLEGSIAPTIRALCEVGDQLVADDGRPSGIFSLGIDVHIGRIIWQLLRRVPEEPSRFELLRDAIEKGEALGTIVREVAIVGQQHGKYGGRGDTPEEDRLLTPEHVEQLEQLAARRIRQAAEQGTLLGHPQLASILYRWRDWGTEAEVKEWVEHVAQTDDGFITLLQAFVNTIRSQTLGDMVTRSRLRLDLKQLEPFIAADEVVERVRTLAGQNLPLEQQQTVDQFLLEYDAQKEGRDLDQDD
jgi:predicted KAP-like P-loop ATPase